MRTLRFLLQKEFRQIFRNKALLPVIFVAPLIQLLVLPLAADYEMKNINIAIVDHDRSYYSSQLISKITASGYFRLAGFHDSYNEAFVLIERDAADLVLEIPAGFERDLVRDKEQKVFLAINAINGTKANLGGAYIRQIIGNFNEAVRLEWIQPDRFRPRPMITITSANWFNSHMNYRFFMVPAILAVLVTMVGSYMASLNIVKEKEIGTIEQINVTPIKKHHFIMGKLIPFWIIGMVIFTAGLGIVAWQVYGIVPKGSLLLLYGVLSVYLLAALGLGLLISTYSHTQQQAMSVAFFFMMIFLMMSGLFTPVESMPGWAQVIAYLNPVTYFISIMRMIVLRGSSLVDIQWQFLAICGFAVVLNAWAILNYRKTT